MHGDFVVGDFKSNRIKRFSVRRHGAGFAVRWKHPLLQSKHRNFRPVDVKVGPDGAIYISDDYAGAIYRVSYGDGEASPGLPATGHATNRLDARPHRLHPAHRNR